MMPDLSLSLAKNHSLRTPKIIQHLEKIINRNFLSAQSITACNKLNTANTQRKEGFGLADPFLFSIVL